jgi:hypothetical protein
VGNRDGGLGDPSKQYGLKRLNILYRLLYWKVSHHHLVDVDSYSTSICRTEPEMTETKEAKDIDQSFIDKYSRRWHTYV